MVEAMQIWMSVKDDKHFPIIRNIPSLQMIAASRPQ